MPDAKPHAKPAGPPIASATVLTLRDGADGLEVFMLVRNRQVDFASGALVFPGGKVDAQDTHADWARLAPLSQPAPERSYWVAALRETFEETGLLLAEPEGARVTIAAEVAMKLAHAHREDVASGKLPFARLIESAGLVLATERMVPFAHWITPDGMPKRFDTHFFLAAAPPGQAARHDGGEAVESMWIRPTDAVRDAVAGRRTLVPATQLNLEKLAAAPTVAEAFVQARASRIVSVTPTVVRAEGGVVIRIPADAGYATTEVFLARASPA